MPLSSNLLLLKGISCGLVVLYNQIAVESLYKNCSIIVEIVPLPYYCPTPGFQLLERRSLEKGDIGSLAVQVKESRLAIETFLHGESHTISHLT